MTINMSSDFSRDVGDHLSNSQIISGGNEGTLQSVGGVTCRASSAAVELGRRLLAAARSGDTETVLELMARGAPFSSDWLGTSPLHLAAKHAHAETCAVLLRAGVSRDVRTKVDRTPLHLAAYGGHARVVSLLLEQGAHVDPRDMLRMTPLHWAAERGHAVAAATLLCYGADPAAVSKFRKTPLALAAAGGHHQIVRLMEDALREREAARSVDALLTEHMTESTTPQPNVQHFETIVQKVEETKPASKPKEPDVEADVKMSQEGGGGGGGEGAGAQLLRRHGITLLPHDPSSTVLNAIHSGRTVVLSDAGKLMLKESEGPPPAKRMAPGGNKGVVLAATPVKTAPKQSVKIFTLNNKLIALPKQKIINPQLKQVKIVQLSSDVKIMGTNKTGVPTKAKERLGKATPLSAPTTAVKIFMNKTNFNKLLANTDKSIAENIQTEIQDKAAAASESRTLEEDVEEILRVPEDFLQRCSSRYLRTHALAARRALAALKTHFDDCKATLARYENSGG